MERKRRADQIAVAMPPRRAKKMGQLNIGMAKGYLKVGKGSLSLSGFWLYPLWFLPGASKNIGDPSIC